jgi:O-antigen/teichoic acid export membrane protein
MNLSRNFLAGLANSVWSALIGLAVIPLYLKYLGIESYGLIGFFATLQAVFWILDLGLAPTINREVARCSVSGKLQEAGTLLHTLAIICWSMGVLIALLVVAMAPLIARDWLQSNRLPLTSITHALMLMGLVIACRWPTGLYQGALMGAQRMTVSSGIGIAFSTISNLGAVAVLAFVSPTIEAFFVWQAAAGLAQAAAMRWAAWRIVGRQKGIRFESSELRRIWRFSAGISGLALATSVLMQLDKVLLSRILSLEEFGKYALAGVITSGLYVLLAPIFNVIYPRFSALVSAGNTEVLTNLYRLGTRLLSAVLFPIAILAGVFAEDLVYVWTGNSSVSVGVAPILSLLLMGTAINGIMIFPYALQLAYGALHLPLKICLTLIVGTVPVTIYLALEYGAIGGASAWLLMNGIYLIMGSWLTHRLLLTEIGFKWLFWDAGLPLAVSLVVVRGVGEGVHDMGLSHAANLALALAVALIGILALILASPRLVRMLRSRFLENAGRVQQNHG